MIQFKFDAEKQLYRLTTNNQFLDKAIDSLVRSIYPVDRALAENEKCLHIAKLCNKRHELGVEIIRLSKIVYPPLKDCNPPGKEPENTLASEILEWLSKPAEWFKKIYELTPAVMNKNLDEISEHNTKIMQEYEADVAKLEVVLEKLREMYAAYSLETSKKERNTQITTVRYKH